MKKISTLLCAAILAFGSFAFAHTTRHSAFADPYWFQTQTNGTVINSTGIPPQQAADPFNCTTGSNFCSKAYSSYVLVSPGVYGPSGTLQQTHMKP